MFNPDGVPVWAVRHLLDGDVAWHDHDFFEISLVTQGSATYLSTEGDRPLGPGAVTVVRPGEYHAFSGCARLTVFDCFVGPEVLDTVLAPLAQKTPLLGVMSGVAPPLSSPSIQLGPSEISRCVGELHTISDASAGERSLLGVLGHLLIYLDTLDRACQNGGLLDAGSRAQPHPVAVQAMALMKADLAHAWTLGELSSKLAIERSHLVRVFRQSVGTPPITYLNGCRAQSAASLLARSDQPVRAIAIEVGWPDAAYFARRFRDFFGMTPSSYRLRARCDVSRSEPPIPSEAVLPISGVRPGIDRAANIVQV